MKITIIGFGNMGKVFAESLARNLKGCSVFISDMNLKPGAKLGLPNLKMDLNMENITQSDFVILAVKPKDLAGLAGEIRGRIGGRSILISIAAGVKMSSLEKLFQHKKIVRCMPNMAIKNGEGVIGWIAQSLDGKEKKEVGKFISAVAENFEVKEESLIDAVTAISGSGPAYFLLLARELLKNAIRLGFSKEQANLLVTKTLVGAGAIKKGEPSVSCDELMKKIASKGGTTEAALKYFSQKGFAKIVKGAVGKAYGRAREMSKEK